MRRRLLVGLFVAVLVGQSALAVQPATAASYPSAEAACGVAGDGERLVGFLPGASDPGDGQVLSGDETLYPGTTFRLALCKDGDLAPTYGSEWTLESSSGLEPLDSTESYVTVRATDDAEDAIDVLELVDEKEGIAAVSVTVRDAPTVDSALASETLTFENRSAAEQYEEAETAFLAAESNLTAATERLDESVAAAESGEAGAVERTNGTATAVAGNRAALADAADALENQTYDAAFRASGETNALAALDAAQQREQAAEANATAAMRDSLVALEAAEGDAQSTALLNLGGAALVGLLIGAIPGWKLTASKLEDIRFDRQVNASVTYGPRVLARAVGLAAVVIVLTAGALVGLGGLAALGGLL